MSRRILLNGQYVVIQTHPLGRRINYICNTFSLTKARQRKELENLAHDYSCFAIRMYFCGKLYQVKPDGTRGIRSLEQDWRIEPSYWDAHCIRSNDAAVLLCPNCSYPFFTNMVMESASGFEPWSQPVTCLVEHDGRQISECPNCTHDLFSEDEEEEDEEDEFVYKDYNYSVPRACEGCQNYHGGFYGNTKLICAIHPSGYSGESCPDYVS